VGVELGKGIKVHIVEETILNRNDVFWDVAPWISYVNRRFGEMYRLYFQGKNSAMEEPS
jgi:hypothetical protein